MLTTFCRLVAVALASVVLLAGCGDEPGNPAVYDRIEQTTDCAALQAEFDQADANRAISDDPSIQTSYMKAADERMRELGCYG